MSEGVTAQEAFDCGMLYDWNCTFAPLLKQAGGEVTPQPLEGEWGE